MKHTKNKLLLVLFLLLCGSQSSSFAARHALLVGISEYPVKPLAGPVNDVIAMKRTLAKKWHFDRRNITTLLNQQATKENIMRELNKVYGATREGDDVFIYLSGHGTSTLDENNIVELPPTSGAFFPVDIMGFTNKRDLANRLIVGQKDLFPILKKFDDGLRNVFVVIDACFSGNTVRSNKLPTRYLSTSDVLTKSAFGDDITPIAETDLVPRPSYPYKNIFYLSAASENQPAKDIPYSMIDRYPTIDSKPHGAFTDTLLRILNKENVVDTNRDGKISYLELRERVRFEMRRRGFEQTPQGLPSEKKDPLNINSRSIFGSENNSTLETAKVINHKDNEPLGIQLDSSVQHIAQTLRKISTVKLVSSLPDILVKRQNSKTLFVGYSGDIMHSLYRPKDSEIIQILRRYARLHYLKQKNYSQEFNVELHTSSPDSGGIVVEGEKVGFSIRTDTPSYILLVNFDPSGIATVIYPDNRSELKKIKANDEMLLKNVSRARAPFGTDYILLYAFDELTHEHELLMGKQFPIDSPLMNKLEHLVRNKNVKKAMADLELITVPKSN